MSADTRQNFGARLGGINSVSAGRNKLILAACLVAVMAIMWGRILLKNKNSVHAAAAGVIAENPEMPDQTVKTKIKYIQLPVITGRNDVLTVNFFSARGWEGFRRESVNGEDDMYGQTSLVAQNGTETDANSEKIRQIAQKLQLEAIAMTERPQAFINNKIVYVGDSVSVKDEADVYEFRTVSITRNAVSLECGGVVVSLKMIQPSESAD